MCFWYLPMYCKIPLFNWKDPEIMQNAYRASVIFLGINPITIFHCGLVSKPTNPNFSVNCNCDFTILSCPNSFPSWKKGRKIGQTVFVGELTALFNLQIQWKLTECTSLKYTDIFIVARKIGWKWVNLPNYSLRVINHFVSWKKIKNLHYQYLNSI